MRLGENRKGETERLLLVGRFIKAGAAITATGLSVPRLSPLDNNVLMLSSAGKPREAQQRGPPGRGRRNGHRDNTRRSIAR